MATARRNDPCPCGSGKKYKNCCLSKEDNNLLGLPHGMRMKGGIRYDPEENGFVVIVHVWDNIDCTGEPQEWRYPQVYADEEEALHFYKTKISRPAEDDGEKCRTTAECQLHSSQIGGVVPDLFYTKVAIAFAKFQLIMRPL